MFLRSAFCLGAALSVLLLSGCAGSVSDAGGLQSFTDAIRGYDSTLTRAEKEAAISELQMEKERQEAQIDQSDGASKTN